ncbi:SulP family inorganic anion transporter [Streptomyces sp. NPDC057403]|uniref:SulP family inorganic anion transporter n=1 Tax=Streptomyces sp. NPDC057403 TaxID=3346119 RepID=UPI0036BDBB95
MSADMHGLFPSMRRSRRQWLGRDALAGTTVWAVLVPEALAYATIAGVSPVVGLYASSSGPWRRRRPSRRRSSATPPAARAGASPR